VYTGHELPNSKPFENQTNDTVQNIGGAYKGMGRSPQILGVILEGKR